MADIIQINYEAVQKIAGRFEDNAERMRALSEALRGGVDNLRGGGWIGRGADAFYREMDQLVLPTLVNLQQALTTTSSTLDTITQQFRQSEEEAEQTVRGETAPGNGTAGSNGQQPVSGQPASGSKYVVQRGDTLWDIARRHGTTVDALVAANNIPDRNLIHPGQELIIPGGGAAGGTPVPVGGTPVSFTPGPSGRSAADLNSRIDSFNVESNHKYARNRQGRDETYCNIYAMDVANSMGAPIPEYVRNSSGQVRYLDANLMKDWLEGRLNVPGSYTQGPANGWVKVDHSTAAQAANQGYVVVAAGHGHMAVVRAGTPEGAAKGDVLISQAGLHNFNLGPIKDGWGRFLGEAEFYVHKP